MFTRTQKTHILLFDLYNINTRKSKGEAFWGECSPFSSPSMHLFSSTYRIRVKGEGKKAKNSERARRYAHAKNAKKTFVYAFLDKYRETRGHTFASRTERTRRSGAQRPKQTTSESRAGHFPMCSFAKGKGKRVTETEGDQWGCFNRAMCCFIFLSCARCSVQSRWLRPSSFRFAVVD